MPPGPALRLSHQVAEISLASNRFPASGDDRCRHRAQRAILGVSATAAVALAPLCVPPAQAHAEDPCISVTEPAAHQDCIDEFLRDHPMHRYRGECQSSPRWGAEGQFCRNSWVTPGGRNHQEPLEKNQSEAEPWSVSFGVPVDSASAKTDTTPLVSNSARRTSSGVR